MAISTKCVLYIPLYDHWGQGQVFQANKFFGRGVLPVLLKVIMIKLHCGTCNNKLI